MPEVIITPDQEEELEIRDMYYDRDRVLQLMKEKCYKKGEFTLSSGRKSEHYVNLKPCTLNGDALLFLSWCLYESIEEDTVAVAGLTLGADPLVAGVAMCGAIEERRLDGLIVRKEPKGHGTNAWIEGPPQPKGSKVTVLEDVTTTGGSSIKAALKLREAGYTVDRIVTILDRQVDDEAYINAEKNGIDIVVLFKLEELLDD